MVITVEAKAIASSTRPIRAMNMLRRVQRRRRPEGSKKTGLPKCPTNSVERRRPEGSAGHGGGF